MPENTQTLNSDQVAEVVNDMVYAHSCVICNKPNCGVYVNDKALCDDHYSEHEKRIAHKNSMIRELAKLCTLNWNMDNRVKESIFPYVLEEVITLLLNANLDIDYNDYAKTQKSIGKIIRALAK